jgi:ferredoxin-like protein FixX
MFSACLSVSDFATHRHIAFARFVLEVDALFVFYLQCLECGVAGLLCLSKERNDPYSTTYIHGAIPFLHAPLGR